MGGMAYEPADESQYFVPWLSLPAVLTTHFGLSVVMLLAIVAQVLLAFVGSFISKQAFGLHARLGLGVAFVILTCIFPAIAALGTCDVLPKRGSEALFFVAIGTAIPVVLVQGLTYVSQKLYGLHFQYMTFTVYLISSPGWIRILSIAFRYVLASRIPGFSPTCFLAITFTKVGYLYTYAFVVGFAWILFWWQCPCSPCWCPFFKKFSLGLLTLGILVALLVGCLYQMLITWTGDPYDHGTYACDDMHIARWKNLSTGFRVQGMYSSAKGYGICTPSNTYKLPGVPAMLADDPEVVVARSPGRVNVGFGI